MSVAFICAQSISFPQVHGVSARLLPLLAIRIDKKLPICQNPSSPFKCCCNSNEIPHVTLCSLDNKTVSLMCHHGWHFTCLRSIHPFSNPSFPVLFIVHHDYLSSLPSFPSGMPRSTSAIVLHSILFNF